MNKLIEKEKFTEEDFLVMQVQEKAIRRIMVQQYYNYITLLRLTNNFQKEVTSYETIDFNQFSGRVAIVGSILKIHTEKDTPYKDFFFPIVQTAINRFFFFRQDYSVKNTKDPICRKLIVPSAQYMKKLIKPFNRIINICKKQTDQFFIFTNLKIHIKDDDQVCFSLTPDSYIGQLEKQYYQGAFKIIQKSLRTNYSELSIHQVFNQFQVPKMTFVIKQFKQSLMQNIDEMSIMGVLQSINRQSMKKTVNAKQREVSIDIIQDCNPSFGKTLGISRVYVRYDIEESVQMENILQEGCVYAMCSQQILINHSLNISFKVQHWKKNFFKVTNEPVKVRPIQQIYDEMQISPIRSLVKPFIYRNIMKFKVFKYDLKFFYLNVTCQKCNNSCVRIGEYEYRCKLGCQDAIGKLKLWVIMSVMDSSASAELNIEDQQVLRFFGIEEEAMKIKDEVMKELQTTKGLTLYFKRSKKQQNQNEFRNQGLIYENNEYLKGILYKCLVNVVQRQVIGAARSNMQEYFQNFSEDVKNEFQIGFTRTKEYLRKANVFANGNLRDTGDDIQLIPHIKVERVLKTK